LEAGFLRRIITRLAAEGVQVGQALGYSLVAIYGALPEAWTTAAQGDQSSASEIDQRLKERLGRVTSRERPSVAQDLVRGRRTEIDYTNGLIVSKARMLGIAAPVQETTLAIVRRIERGDLAPSPATIAGSPEG
jgi:2-dehydropantoate 2-reductase